MTRHALHQTIVSACHVSPSKQTYVLLRVCHESLALSLFSAPNSPVAVAQPNAEVQQQPKAIERAKRAFIGPRLSAVNRMLGGGPPLVNEGQVDARGPPGAGPRASPRVPHSRAPAHGFLARRPGGYARVCERSMSRRHMRTEKRPAWDGRRRLAPRRRSPPKNGFLTRRSPVRFVASRAHSPSLSHKRLYGVSVPWDRRRERPLLSCRGAGNLSAAEGRTTQQPPSSAPTCVSHASRSKKKPAGAASDESLVGT